ncbi:MAG: site-specific integrase [Ilumatobacteraceae bacterium]
MLSVDGGRRKVRGATKAAVLAKLNTMRAEVDRGIVSPDGNATVQSLLDQWAQRVVPNRNLAPKSRENYELAVRVLGAEFGRDRLTKLNTARVERGLEHIATGVHGRGKPLGRRSMKLYRETLVQAVDAAVRREQLHRNPAQYAELPAGKATGRARRALSTDDARRLWAVCDDGRLGAAFRLMLSTTMRPGEALGVCFDAIDWDTGELMLRRAVRLERGRAVLVEGAANLKTVNAARPLIVPPPALAALRGQVARVAELRIAARRWSDPDPGLLFPTVFGGPWNPRNARGELAALCVRAGVPIASPGELRHTAKAILDDARVDPVVIRNLMGHSTEWMQDHYGNRSRRAEDGHVEIMCELFARVEGRRAQQTAPR